MFVRSGTTTLALGVAAIAASGAWGGSGCSATKPTEIVPGALTQIAVPQDLAGIKVEVLADGAPKFNNSYTVQNGQVLLPATLGITGSSSTTVTVIIGGYDATGIQGQFFGDGSQPVGEVGTPGGPRVRRGSVQTYVDQRTLFLPLNLSYSCYDLDCDSGSNSSTCKGNTCTSSSTDSNKLVDFDPSLVDGTQDCFNPSLCFPPQATVNAAPVGALSGCLFELPPGTPAGAGLNVRVAYQDMQLGLSTKTGVWETQLVPTSESEILNVEPASASIEGFAIPSSSSPTQFTLAPGLCALVQASQTAPSTSSLTAGQTTLPYHTISTIQASTVCASKPPLLPFCANEQNPLTKTAEGGTTTQVKCGTPIPLVPAPSAVYLLMDGSSVMSAAFGSQGFGSTTAAALGNPVFKNTSVAFEFLDDVPGDCTAAKTPYTSPGSSVPRSLDFTPAAAAESTLSALLASPKFTDTPQSPQPLDLLTALRPAGGAYQHLADYVAGLALTSDAGTSPSPVAIATLMIFVNRVPGSGLGDAGSDAFTGADCALTGGATSALAEVETDVSAAAAQGLSTYFVVLGDDSGESGATYAFYHQVASDLSTKGVAGVLAIDATENNEEGTIIGRIASAVVPLGTCLYEIPPGIDTSATLHFTLPVPVPGLTPTAPLAVPLAYDPNCNAASQATANGWNIDGAHLRVCGTATNQNCADVRLSVEAVTALTLTAGNDAGMLNGAPSSSVPDVPVAATMTCAK